MYAPVATSRGILLAFLVTQQHFLKRIFHGQPRWKPVHIYVTKIHADPSPTAYIPNSAAMRPDLLIQGQGCPIISRV